MKLHKSSQQKQAAHRPFLAGPTAVRRPQRSMALALDATGNLKPMTVGNSCTPSAGVKSSHSAAASEAASGGHTCPAAAAAAALPATEQNAPKARRNTAAAASRGVLVAVHAISSTAFMAGATAVELFTTLPVLLRGDAASTLFYPSTAAAAWGWAGLVAASALSGWALAARERRGAERSNFQDYAVQAVLGQLFTLWLSPYWALPRSWGPAADVAMGVAIVAVSALQLATQASGAHRAAIAHGRRRKAAAGSSRVSETGAAAAAAAELPGWAQSAAYFQPAAVGPIMMLAAGGIQVCVPFTWLSAFQALHPQHAAVAFHFGIITTLSGHAGMFASTLRDRRGLPQWAEAAACALSYYGALALLAAFMLNYTWLWQVAGPWATLFRMQ